MGDKRIVYSRGWMIMMRGIYCQLWTITIIMRLILIVTKNNIKNHIDLLIITIKPLSSITIDKAHNNLIESYNLNKKLLTIIETNL